MYKIVYIKNTPLLLGGQELPAEWPENGNNQLLARYPGKKKFLLHYIDMLEKTDRYERVGLYAEDPEQLWQDFRSQCTIVEAAGGLVRRPDGDLLFIFRRGHWDLPKGKIDRGEGPKEAALREVREETGLKELTLLAPLPVTYHVYRLPDGRRVLKPTHWFLMESSQQTLHPEAEEDIERAEWLPLDRFLREKGPTYGNILRLLHYFRDAGDLP